jgi:hypothetical protein
MGEVGFMAPTAEQQRQAILSGFLTTKNLGTIGLVFVASLVILFFLKRIRSLIVKIFLALLVAVIFGLCLYFRTAVNIRF